jgi:hypothetical protein
MGASVVWIKVVPDLVLHAVSLRRRDAGQFCGQDFLKAMAKAGNALVRIILREQSAGCEHDEVLQISSGR